VEEVFACVLDFLEKPPLDTHGEVAIITVTHTLTDVALSNVRICAWNCHSLPE
jgi:hypothetical protein